MLFSLLAVLATKYAVDFFHLGFLLALVVYGVNKS
jgi:mannose/fructose/N-acetylgalactosamine-specific phosphotransferase system component IIC